MTRSRIWEFEAWPQKGRRPSVTNLRTLARIYETTARRLLTHKEYFRYSDAERLQIDQIDYRPSKVQLALSEAPKVPEFAEPSGDNQALDMDNGCDVANLVKISTIVFGRNKTRKEDLKRREFGRALASITLALPLAGVANGEPVDVTPLSPDEVVADLYALDDRYGGAAIAGIARRRLASLTRQLNMVSLQPSVETRIHSMVGALATCAAWLTYDSGNVEQARSLDTQALYAAHLANNRDLQIEVLASMSMQANVCDRPDEAINLAESAKTIGRTAEARVRSLLAMRVAIAAARKRDEGLFRSARSEAWDLLENAREYDHPAWFNFFDERELIGLEALSLMRLDRHEEAANILNDVVGHKTNYVRNRAYYATVQAKALIGAGKPEGAVMTLRDNALPVLTEVTSKRTLDWLNKVRTGLQPFAAKNSDIEECCEALDDFLL